MPAGLLSAASFGDVFGTIVGVLLGLAGLSTALMCLLALGDGAIRRGTAGLVAGLLLLALGLRLIGLF